jgi:hypothetical protein
MKIVKGAAWLKRDFIEQLKQSLEANHVVEIDKLVDFDGKEQLVKNMFIRKELAKATNNDVKWQNGIELTKKAEALKDAKLINKLEEEEAALKAAMGI